MPLKDAKLELQAAVTKTADFNGTALDLTTSMALRGLGVEVAITAVDRTTGDERYILRLEESKDNVSFNTLYEWDELDTAANTVPRLLYAKVSSRKQFVRLILAGVVGTTPSITYNSNMMLNVPGGPETLST